MRFLTDMVLPIRPESPAGCWCVLCRHEIFSRLRETGAGMFCVAGLYSLSSEYPEDV
jgi:hypothetical protein